MANMVAVTHFLFWSGKDHKAVIPRTGPNIRHHFNSLIHLPITIYFSGMASQSQHALESGLGNNLDRSLVCTEQVQIHIRTLTFTLMSKFEPPVSPDLHIFAKWEETGAAKGNSCEHRKNITERKC